MLTHWQNITIADKLAGIGFSPAKTKKKKKKKLQKYISHRSNDQKWPKKVDFTDIKTSKLRKINLATAASPQYQLTRSSGITTSFNSFDHNLRHKLEETYYISERKKKNGKNCAATVYWIN